MINDINITDAEGLTPIYHALENDDLEVFNFFVLNGANIRMLDKDGWSLLHLAADKGEISFVKKLLELGMKDDVLTNKGNTAKELALIKNHDEVADLL